MSRISIWLLVLGLWPLAALAHKPSDSYLRLAIEPGALTGRWDIALRDLDHAIGLDRDGDGRITWGELRAEESAISAYALARLDLETDEGPCATESGRMLVDRHADGAYAILPLTAHCPGETSAVRLAYRLFADLNSLHRGLVQVDDGAITHTAVLGPDQPTMRLSRAEPDRFGQALTFVRAGIVHVASGADHILFLVSLLLPAVLRRRDGLWEPATDFRQALTDVAKTVTAFTLAHSLTLALAAADLVTLPSRLVEASIATTILLAALNNLVPIVTRRLWLMAFAFGLVHGLGFAGALQALGLQGEGLIINLLMFNIGVELVQLAVVMVLLPAAFLMRRAPVYAPVVLQGGSVTIALAGCVWLVSRLGVAAGIIRCAAVPIRGRAAPAAPRPRRRPR